MLKFGILGFYSLIFLVMAGLLVYILKNRADQKKQDKLNKKDDTEV